MANISERRVLELAERFNMWELVPRALVERWTATEFEAKALARMRHRSTGFKFERVLREMQNGLQGLDGYEEERLKEWSGAEYPGRLHVPWSELAATRDLNVANAGQGGYLVDVANLPAADILRPWSVTARAGVQFLENQSGQIALPKTTSKATITWQGAETTQISASTPALAQIASTPKVAIGVVQFSRQLKLQSNVEAYIRRELLKTAGTAIDQAVLSGSGASGAPLGVTNTPGIGTQSGTSLAHTGVTAMKTAVANANAQDESIAFVGTPTVRGLLEGRERATGLGFIWDKGLVASAPGYASTDVPASTLICGVWSTIVVPLYGAGIVLEFNPFDPTLFKQSIIQARVLVQCDVMVTYPAAFSVASSVT
jgi:hypothetical protein